MRTVRLAVLALVAVGFAGCGKDIHDFVVTEANQKTFLEDLKDRTGLTVDESRLLLGYVMRLRMVEGAARQFANPQMADVANQLSPVGKTVRELIAAQRAWKESNKRRPLPSSDSDVL